MPHSASSNEEVVSPPQEEMLLLTPYWISFKKETKQRAAANSSTYDSLSFLRWRSGGRFSFFLLLPNQFWFLPIWHAGLEMMSHVRDLGFLLLPVISQPSWIVLAGHGWLHFLLLSNFLRFGAGWQILGNIWILPDFVGNQYNRAT